MCKSKAFLKSKLFDVETRLLAFLDIFSFLEVLFGGPLALPFESSLCWQEMYYEDDNIRKLQEKKELLEKQIVAEMEQRRQAQLQRGAQV